MIIARSPLRITLGGGGTDLPSYYTEHGGFALAAAIDKYVYVTVMRPFSAGIYLKYSSLEHVEQVADVRHPIIREALREALALERSEAPQIEITTLADIPAGTGLGSSGSFTTALLKALLTHHRKVAHAQELAEMACDIEINKLREPIGKQDQYASAFGGITCLTFHRDHRVEVEPLRLSSETIFALEDNLLLFFTGVRRASSSILKDQHARSQAHDPDMRRNLDFVKMLGHRSREALEAGDLIRFGELMHEHWEHKRRRSAGVSNLQIDDWYSRAMNNGAVGGKLVGAGGGGFLMFYAADRNRLRRAMTEVGLEEVRFRFDFEGTKVVLS
jgi:D-glycero-alpha-D-manno-heptose-7-phosphate kinase